MGFIKTLIGGVGGFLVGGPAGAVVGASIGGGMDAADAQSKSIGQASNTSAQSANYAADLQKQAFDQQQATQRPFLEAGYMGVDSLRALMSGQPVRNTQTNDYAIAAPAATTRTSSDRTRPTMATGRTGISKSTETRPILSALTPQTDPAPGTRQPATPREYLARDVTPVPYSAQLPTGMDVPQLGQMPELFSQPNLPEYGNMVERSNLPDYNSLVPRSQLPSYDDMVTTANIEEDPAYRWRVEQGTKMANRALASRGLSGGGQAVTTLRDLSSQVAGEEYGNMFDRNRNRYAAAMDQEGIKYGQNQNAYVAGRDNEMTRYAQSQDAYRAATDRANSMYGADKESYAAKLDRIMNQYNANMKGLGLQTDLANQQYGRLTDLVKIGQGAAGAVNSAQQNYGTNAANIQLNAGTNLANAQLAQGQNKSNLYQGIGNAGMQLGSLAIMGGYKPFGG